MRLFDILFRKLHTAPAQPVSNAGPAPANVTPLRSVPAMGRARVPLNLMPRLGEVDGPTVAFPITGPAVNAGSGHRSHRRVDGNRVPERLTRQRVA